MTKAPPETAIQKRIAELTPEDDRINKVWKSARELSYRTKEIFSWGPDGWMLSPGDRSELLSEQQDVIRKRGHAEKAFADLASEVRSGAIRGKGEIAKAVVTTLRKEYYGSSDDGSLAHALGIKQSGLELHILNAAGWDDDKHFFNDQGRAQVERKLRPLFDAVTAGDVQRTQGALREFWAAEDTAKLEQLNMDDRKEKADFKPRVDQFEKLVREAQRAIDAYKGRGKTAISPASVRDSQRGARADDHKRA